MVVNKKIDVLDHGYVVLVDSMGSDLTTVNAARASFAKRSTTFTKKDANLIKFLGENDHTSPFRHSVVQFEVKAPLMAANQWFRYVIGAASGDPFFAWNEQSRRYTTSDVEFYIPTQWRSAPENKKQGSGGAIENLDVVEWANSAYKDTLAEGLQNYNYALADGIAVEQARLFLPAYALYTTWYWTASLQGVAHFLNQRLKPDAQKEIRDYAEAVHQLVQPLFPNSLAALCSAEPSSS